MAVLDPDHLFAQADRLIIPHQPGRPLQVDVRRAISAAYYGLFHFLLAAAADEFVGKKHRTTARYAVVYRSIDHRQLSDLCKAMKSGGGQSGALSLSTRKFATAVLQLQNDRHTADYDPTQLLPTLTAREAVATAREEIARFVALPASERQTFLTMLCFKRR